MARTESETLTLDGHEVTISNPGKIFFADAGVTKIDLVRYYLAVADGAILGVRDRPMALKRFVDGAGGEAFFQKRAPKSVPDFVRTVELSFPSGRTADEVVVDNAAALAWVVNLGCIDLNPHAVRAGDLEHPDELRVDLDPGPGVPWTDVRAVALVVREVLEELGYTAWPKTSGSRGIHVYVRIESRWGFSDVRRAALAIAREVERRAPDIATSKWWKEERHGVFLDYNQNAKDRTVASVYSVRPRPDATVSAPLTLGRGRGRRARRLHAENRARALREAWGRRGRHRRDGTLARAASGARRAPRVRGPRRRALAAELRKAGRRAATRPALEATNARPRRRVTDPSAPRGRAGSVAPARPPAPARNADGSIPPTGRRRSTQPLLVISQAADKADALAGLDRWRARHPEAAASVRDPEDVLVDGMRGRYKLWWRVRVNLRNVPEELRPAAEPPDPDYDPWAE